MSPRPFRVLGVQQIALGNLDRTTLSALWVDCLGLTPRGTYRSEAENVDEEILTLGNGPFKVELDLMQPVDPTRKPAVHIPALNHVGLWVDHLRAAFCWMVCHGVRFTPGGIRRGASGHEVCFIHPRPSQYFQVSGNGVLVELVQAPDNVVDAHGR